MGEDEAYDFLEDQGLTQFQIDSIMNHAFPVNKIKLKESVMGENPYFDTDPSDGDADHDDNMKYGAENYWDKGKKAFEEGDLEKAQEYYEQALEFGSWLGWTERELPPYKSESLNENEAELLRESKLRSVIKSMIKETLK
jgi:tetratricopeptide (TPR) repeat protein